MHPNYRYPYGLPLEFRSRPYDARRRFMKLSVLLPAAMFVAATAHAEVPKPFAGLFEKDVPVRGQIGMPMPPPEINKYIAKVEAAAEKDMKWFKEYSSQQKANAPLPYHEKLGLTKEEYDDYLKLWSQREFKPITDDVMLLLRQKGPEIWSLTATGAAAPISIINYSTKDDTFQSANGKLVRGEDIHAGEESILGKWDGAEWKFEEESSFGKTRENIAYGRYADGKFGLIVYRFIEISSEGTKLADKSLAIRFPLGKAAAPAATPEPAPKATPKTTPKKK